MKWMNLWGYSWTFLASDARETVEKINEMSLELKEIVFNMHS